MGSFINTDGNASIDHELNNFVSNPNDINIKVLLRNYTNRCSAYKWMHQTAYAYYTRINKVVQILNTFLVSLTATSNSITNIYIGSNDVLMIIYTIMFYSAAVITTLQHFLNYEREAERHNSSATKYTSLYNVVYRRLLVPGNSDNLYEFFQMVSKEYDSLSAESPDIPEYIIKEYQKEFKCDIDNLKVIDLDMIINKETNGVANLNYNNNQNYSGQSLAVNADQKDSATASFMVDSSNSRIASINIESSNLYEYELDRFVLSNYK